MLNIWELPTGMKPTPIKQFISLALPSLSFGLLIFSFGCRCKPNFMPGGALHSKAPFHPNSEDAIIVLNVQIQSLNGLGMYSLFVHRSALLRVCTTESLEDEDGVSHCIPNVFSVERIPGKGVRAWANWGPPITHMFDTSQASLSWITTTTGQWAIVRCNDSDDEDDEDGQRLQLLDFNPSTMKRVVQNWNDGLGEFDSHEFELDTTATVITGIEHPIQSQLPYVGVNIPLQDSWINCFKGFLLYEEGVLVLLYQDHLRPVVPAWQEPSLAS
ncbi:hypothetical protein C0995_016424 [Termitomyces sp. Mi166|nr:hypothetical protein C0995_016424 [Termitomyces sp. Mi166\